MEKFFKEMTSGDRQVLVRIGYGENSSSPYFISFTVVNKDYKEAEATIEFKEKEKMIEAFDKIKQSQIDEFVEELNKYIKI